MSNSIISLVVALLSPTKTTLKVLSVARGISGKVDVIQLIM